METHCVTGSRRRWARRPGSVALVIAVLATGLATIGTPAHATAQTCRIESPTGHFAYDTAQSSVRAQVWRLYQAYFLRQPDERGFEYWVDVSQEGDGLETIADLFAASDEFRQRYRDQTDRQFVELVYRNVLCRDPDGDGFEYWVGQLSSGRLGRGELLVYFSEGDEYLAKTRTRWSAFADPSAATFAEDGYELRSVPGGVAVDVDYSEVDVQTSHDRCGIASINANWFHTPDRSNPTPIGFAVIDFEHVPGSVNGNDRGIIGERFRRDGVADELVWTFEGSFNLSSNLHRKRPRVLESWAAWQPPHFAAIDDPDDWKWAAAGIPLIVAGQVWHGLYGTPATDPVHAYTHGTRRHSFLAFDTDRGLMTLGSTTSMTSYDLVDWARSEGYDDLVKFDGGGSVEFNVGGVAWVAGTSRDVPVWLGVGC